MKTKRAMVLVSSDKHSIEQGAMQVFEALEKEIARRNLETEVSLTMMADIGRQDVAPLVVIYPEATIYGPVTPKDVPFLVEEHLYKGRIAGDLQAPVKELSGKIAWITSRKGSLPAEQRIVLERAGIIDPEKIEDYILYDGYQALGKVLGGMTQAEVIEIIEKSGLPHLRFQACNL